MKPKESWCARCQKAIGEDDPCVEVFRQEGDGEPRRVKVLCLPCGVSERVDEYNKSGRISTSLATEVQVTKAWADIRGPALRPDFVPIQRDLERVYEAVAEFGKAAWRAIVAATDAEQQWRALSCEIPGAKIMTWTMCARTMVTIEGGEHSVTVMGDEHWSDDPDAGNTCGFRGIDATADAAVKLLRNATEAARKGLLGALRPDSGVSYCGI